MKKGQMYIHIILLSIAILTYSSMCWINFAKEMLFGNLAYVSYDDTESEEKSDDSIEKNKIYMYAKSFDDKIKQFDYRWYNSMYGKDSLSKTDSTITYMTIDEVISNNVLMGNNGWLFYKSKSDGDSIADYEGTNLYSNDYMDSILENLSFVQDKFESMGIEFVILVAPNKENIYYEYMPDKYIHADISRTDILIDYLYDNDINIVNPKQELLHYHNDFQLYYYYDTHWNQLGAYIGVRAIASFWGENMPNLDACSISSKKLSEVDYPFASDDLAEMIGLKDYLINEMEYEIKETVPTEQALYGEDIVSYFHNSNAENDLKVLLIGDSFRTAMIPALRMMYTDVYVVYKLDYSSKILDEICPDRVIVEYVERYSGQLFDLNFLIE
ncbi:MAG: hypothetical protein IJ763_03640 [Lachnospiraceae bacterium]|nr:hypothetical protein [Lachnospiraceae bacterium]